MADRCFACGRQLSKVTAPQKADTRDAQIVLVGSDCFKHISAAGDAGWQPPKGGPRLYPMPSRIPGTRNFAA